MVNSYKQQKFSELSTRGSRGNVAIVPFASEIQFPISNTPPVLHQEQQFRLHPHQRGELRLPGCEVTQVLVRNAVRELSRQPVALGELIMRCKRRFDPTFSRRDG
jgi:hypothetical protein